MKHRTGCTMEDAGDKTERSQTPLAPDQDPGAAAQEQPDMVEKKRYDELNDRFLRLAADFDNFKKRTARECESIARFANEHFAVDLLDITDNLERASKSDDAHLREGIEHIRELLAAILQRHHITPIESLKKQFNPEEHEAIAHIISDDDEGTVIDEVCRGYRMHEKVIRYAKVAVSKGKEKRKTEA